MSIVLRFFYFSQKNKNPPVDLYRIEEAIGIGENEAKNVWRYNHYMAQILNGMASSIDSCDIILGELSKVASGEKYSTATGGNDFLLNVTGNIVQVSITNFDEWSDQPEGIFTLKEWLKALNGWRCFLQLPESLDSIVEVAL